MDDWLPRLSDIMKEMAKQLLRNRDAVPSSEAADAALFIAKTAWNEGVGLDQAREGCRRAWESAAAANPELPNESEVRRR